MGISITEIFIRSISGYIFIVPGILLYFLCLKKAGKKQPSLHIAAVFVFCYYLIGILTMMGIGKPMAFSPRIVLVPFLDMINGPIDTLLNILLFFPLGFFLSLLYRKYDHPGKAALTGFLLSLSIEIIQMFGRGATDVNDLITNTAGTVLGYFLYQSLPASIRKKCSGRFHADKIHDGMEILFFAAYAFIVMTTVQSSVISSLFGLG